MEASTKRDIFHVEAADIVELEDFASFRQVLNEFCAVKLGYEACVENGNNSALTGPEEEQGPQTNCRRLS